jgi:hypothetical protein
VHFESNDGKQAVKTFTWEQLRIVEPRNPDPRQLPPDGQAALDTLTAKFEATIEHWNSVVRAHGAEPGDTRRYHRALDRHTQRHAATIIAEQPEWLHQHLGDRAGDVAGARTWDDALSAVVVWRNQHNIDTGVDGLGSRPDDTPEGDRWDQLSLDTAHARVWLATTDRTPPDWPIHPSHRELTERLDELEQIFADAPADYRHIIDQLESGQLSFDDTTELLTAATNQQDARRNWIIEHWPHVVEHQQINRTLTLGEWGPGPTIVDTATENLAINDNLRDAITARAPWLRAVLCAIANPGETSIGRESINLLQAIADHRADHNSLDTAPLAPPTISPIPEYIQLVDILNDLALRRAKDGAVRDQGVLVELDLEN